MTKKTVIVSARLLFIWEYHSDAAGSNTIYMSQTVPYSDGTSISRAILDECELPQ